MACSVTLRKTSPVSPWVQTKHGGSEILKRVLGLEWKDCCRHLQSPRRNRASSLRCSNCRRNPSLAVCAQEGSCEAAGASGRPRDLASFLGSAPSGAAAPPTPPQARPPPQTSLSEGLMVNPSPAFPQLPLSQGTLPSSPNSLSNLGAPLLTCPPPCWAPRT